VSDTQWLGTSYPPPDALSPERWEKIGYTRERFVAEYEADVRERARRDRKAPRVGDPAPDFTVERLTPDGTRSVEMFSLSSTRGAPVGLVFGSYT
jgi:hypothetical protein